MATVRFLLDTNTCIALMRNHAIAIQRLAAVTPSACAISTITAFELHTGVVKCAHPAKERAKVDLLLNTVLERGFDSGSASQAAQIRGVLEAAGQPIGPYDLLLAGQAMAYSLTLVTANTREFSRVSGLALENWLI